LAFLAQRLGDRRYFYDDRPTAVDVYVAASMAIFHPLPESVCPMVAPFRQAYETSDAEIRDAVSPTLLALRDRMYEHHLKLPVQL
jgi:glutathione S-transferase